ncbi:CHAD domain-containing protein [Pseudomonas citronellolis]|uniref:CHAD domain-containing protein n=1 Tax=Pseudomonas citronellolis TaxID=53408 RepID=UPI0021BEE4C5|nr:CHAD domain-containing protein [Pseudomonas citronellolis]UXJ50109.1 CHAD domain-containing protein [Pseudomonas citronellolis]
MKFTDKVIARVTEGEVDLYQAYARVIYETDIEALHDFRIALRRLRSLLNPLGKKEACGSLNAVAAEAGRLTTPIRDMEVMAGELEAHGLLKAARVRRQAVSTAYRGLNANPVVDSLFEALDEWPATFRAALWDEQHEHLKAHTVKRIRKQLFRLSEALNDPGHDRHEVRLLVKRARYSQESFPTLLPVPPELMSGLKQLQSALGDWHDRHQWCLKAQHELDLRPLVAEWANAETDALAAAEEVIVTLAGQLADFLGKKNAT